MSAKIILCTLALLIAVTVAQLLYPESDTNENRKPLGHNRPSLVSSKCGEGELLYPGDNEGDWACDCAPTYLYHPQSARCWPVYSRGPCQKSEVLALQKSRSVPVCERSTCEEGKVKFNNVCSKLESHEACKQSSHRLYVNPTTLQLYCDWRGPVRVDVNDDGYYEHGKACFIGGKRSQDGLCQQIVSETQGSRD